MIEEFWCKYVSDRVRTKLFTDRNEALTYAASHNTISSVQHWQFDRNHKNPKCLGTIWTK